MKESHHRLLQLFHSFGDCTAEASGSSRMLCKNLSSNFCFHGRRWCYRCTVCAHDFTLERFLLIRAFYHIYFTVKVKVGTSHGKGSTPLTGSGLCFISARSSMLVQAYIQMMLAHVFSDMSMVDKLRKYFFI